MQACSVGSEAVTSWQPTAGSRKQARGSRGGLQLGHHPQALGLPLLARSRHAQYGRACRASHSTLSRSVAIPQTPPALSFTCTPYPLPLQLLPAGHGICDAGLHCHWGSLHGKQPHLGRAWRSGAACCSASRRRWRLSHAGCPAGRRRSLQSGQKAAGEHHGGWSSWRPHLRWCKRHPQRGGGPAVQELLRPDTVGKCDVAHTTAGSQAGFVRCGLFWSGPIMLVLPNC